MKPQTFLLWYHRKMLCWHSHSSAGDHVDFAHIVISASWFMTLDGLISAKVQIICTAIFVESATKARMLGCGFPAA